MAERSELDLSRISIGFPHHPSRVMAFGFQVVDATGLAVARGMVDRVSILHDYHSGFDVQHKVPDYFDVNSMTHPKAHDLLAKQCVAMTLYDYSLDNPGQMTFEEEQLSLDEMNGAGLYQTTQSLQD